jgi:hypothetical protein
MDCSLLQQVQANHPAVDCHSNIPSDGFKAASAASIALALPALLLSSSYEHDAVCNCSILMLVYAAGRACTPFAAVHNSPLKSRNPFDCCIIISLFPGIITFANQVIHFHSSISLEGQPSADNRSRMFYLERRTEPAC